MNQAQFSHYALAGFLLPFLTVFAVALCLANIPTYYLDHGWGSFIGVTALGFFLLAFLFCGKAIRNIEKSNGSLKGRVLARMGQVLPVVAVCGLVVMYFLMKSRG